MRLIILGAGGYGKTVADVARQAGIYDTVSFLDDGQTGPNILGKCSDYIGFLDGETEIYPAFGYNEMRLLWLDRLKQAGAKLPTIIHPRAYISPEATVEEGTVVLPMAVVNTGVTVKAGCIINIGALIDHDCVIEEGVHLCPGVIVKAENRICGGSKLESGTVVLARQFPPVKE